MIIHAILGRESYSDGFGLDHIELAVNDYKDLFEEYRSKLYGDDPNIKTEIVNDYGTDVLVFYIDNFDRKEVSKFIKELNSE